MPSAEIGILVVWLGVMVALIAGMWKTFEKAGEPGWGAIVPIYNIYLMIKIADGDWYWLLLFIIPVVNGILYLYVQWKIGAKFGLGVIGKLAFMLFAPLSYLATGFGSYRYKTETEIGSI
jgi:hypothetical protein